MLILAIGGPLSIKDMENAFGPNMLKYQLHRLELAGLIDIKDEMITTTESGKAYGALVKSQAEKGGAEDPGREKAHTVGESLLL